MVTFHISLSGFAVSKAENIEPYEQVEEQLTYGKVCETVGLNS
jgi:hypothetical protein